MINVVVTSLERCNGIGAMGERGEREWGEGGKETRTGLYSPREFLGLIFKKK